MGVDALRRDADFVERQADGLGLALEKFAADAVHADAFVAFGDGGEEGDDVNVVSLEEGVKGHGGVFAAGPAEEDGFGHWRISKKLKAYRSALKGAGRQNPHP